jgi:hypothetical protein
LPAWPGGVGQPLAAAAIPRRPSDEWLTLVRLHVERLLDYLEERDHPPDEIDIAADRFNEHVKAIAAATCCVRRVAS